jgi:hypothetical protein
MKLSTRAGSLALYGMILCATSSAQETTAPSDSARTMCDACLEVCAAPLNYDDSLLDESTDNYMPEAAREIATAAAIEMADKLMQIHRVQQAGHFGRTYEANAGAIESLADKQSRDLVTSEEIRSLKRVRTALYADTVVGLKAAAKGSQSQKFIAAYKTREAILDGVIRSLKAPQQMRAAERLAVCAALSAYTDE